MEQNKKDDPSISDQLLLLSIEDELKTNQLDKIEKYKARKTEIKNKVYGVKFSQLEQINEDVVNEVSVDKSVDASSQYNLEMISVQENDFQDSESEYDKKNDLELKKQDMKMLVLYLKPKSNGKGFDFSQSRYANEIETLSNVNKIFTR